MPDNPKNDNSIKMGITAWTTFIVFAVCVCFIHAFFKGRRRFQSNLRAIEGGLKKMQEHLLEEEQRKNSGGCLENIDDIEQLLESLKSSNGRVNEDLFPNMKHQKVVVDIWKMILSSCSYLALAFAFWMFLKLAYACFWLPSHLKKQQEEQSAAEEQEMVMEAGNPEGEKREDKSGEEVGSQEDENKKDV